VKSRVIAYFDGSGTDHAGRRIQDVLAWEDIKLETVHDYIQWLFPNREPSAFSPEAPLLTDQDVHVFREKAVLRAALGSAVDRMERFYKLGDERPWWVTPGNHNFLRLTRILICLNELGLGPRATLLFERLSDIRRRTGSVIPVRTMGFWLEAVG